MVVGSAKSPGCAKWLVVAGHLTSLLAAGLEGCQCVAIMAAGLARGLGEVRRVRDGGKDWEHLYRAHVHTSGNSEVSVQAPTSAPAVLHRPELCSILLLAVSNDHNLMGRPLKTAVFGVIDMVPIPAVEVFGHIDAHIEGTVLHQSLLHRLCIPALHFHRAGNTGGHLELRMRLWRSANFIPLPSVRVAGLLILNRVFTKAIRPQPPSQPLYEGV